MVLLRTPQGEFTVTYGTTLLGATTPPSADTHFRIASNTKTMTAAVIMQLAQEGKLSLDDPVSKYVPGVPNGDKITIAELLEMRSGLYNYTDAPEFSASLDRDPTKVWTPAELLAIAFAHPPNFPPGTAFDYSNTNYALLGLIAEKVDGKPLAKSLQDRLFGPLGLKHTAAPRQRPLTRIPDPYSHGYLYGSLLGRLVGTPPTRPRSRPRPGPAPSCPTTTRARTIPSPRPPGASSPPPTISPPGSRHWSLAGCSTPTISAAGSTACNPKTRASPTGNNTATASPSCAGERTRVYFHGGETPGFNSFMGYDPANKMTLVVWTNLTVSLDES